MSFTFEPGPDHHSYFDSEGDEYDFESKRLKHWAETVPPDIRRWEYDFWKRYRTLVHAGFFAEKQAPKTLRQIEFVPFSQVDQAEYWDEFKESFLRGDERNKRFRELIQTTKDDLPALLERLEPQIQEKDIRLIALGGSVFYGPRRAGSFLSDVDVNFLINSDDGSKNFNFLPSLKPREQVPYHLYGAGYTDQARGPRPIHWLLYPHYPIHNSIPEDELQDILQRLIEDTRSRKEEIFLEIKKLEGFIKEEEEGTARAWAK